MNTAYGGLIITGIIIFGSVSVYNFFKRHPLGKKLLGFVGRFRKVSSEETPDTRITITSTNGDPSDNKQNGGLVGDYGGGVYGNNFRGANYGVKTGNNRTGNGDLVGEDYGGGVYGANFSGGNYGVYEAGRGTTGNDGPFGGRY